jgi:hypothetical protein
VVGIRPWLPWPLSSWRSWTEPVRAERLAALRIGLALILLLDLLFTYLPFLYDLYGRDSLGPPAAFAKLSQAPSWGWSLLRGFGDSLITGLMFMTGLGATVVVLFGLFGRPVANGAREPRVVRYALLVWLAAAVAWLLGVWARLLAVNTKAPEMSLRAALAPWGIASVFWCLGLWRRWRGDHDRQDPWVWPLIVTAWVVTACLALLGLWTWTSLRDQAGVPWPLRWLQTRWEGEPQALQFAMLLYIAADVCLLVGCCTRVSAILVWALSISFANLNSYIDNAGDQVRSIVLFYLVVSPCGAAWSLDRWWQRWRGGQGGPVYIHPWPLRLLFLQLIVIYFFNGFYKIIGDTWPAGESLYYVLCDITLTRVSYSQLPLPYWLTQGMTWAVLAWELGFPLWVSLRWTRVPALWFGVAFHLGIFALMEIGWFGPYMLTLYLPLVPWERWLKGTPAPDDPANLKGG